MGAIRLNKRCLSATSVSATSCVLTNSKLPTKRTRRYAQKKNSATSEEEHITNSCRSIAAWTLQTFQNTPGRRRPEKEVVAPVWEYSEVRTAEQTRIEASSCLERQGVAKANDGERETFVHKIEALQKDEAWIKENDIASISVQTPKLGSCFFNLRFCNPQTINSLPCFPLRVWFCTHSSSSHIRLKFPEPKSVVHLKNRECH